ncbi:MAG: glycoside hydrolase family 3 C-terminal domain-containing protein, partial [Spirochaetaceae bacterium]|nr:glycoside hydrolase family 3 C-terminal domain-containing protein [Spirochaetaceae bacterium]
METQILDWNEYILAARQITTEGVVLLENKNQTLPLKKGTRLAVFGRIQNHYYKSGTGSGGMVNV